MDSIGLAVVPGERRNKNYETLQNLSASRVHRDFDIARCQKVQSELEVSLR